MVVCGSEMVVIPSCIRGLRVLLVDHDMESLKHIASVLELEQSYQVTATERATVALSMIQEDEGQYNLIMADVDMVEMDCFKFINTIAEFNLPIVVMSSREDLSVVKKLVMDYGVNFLRKPCRAKGILNVWQHVYRMRRLEYVEETTDASTEEDNSSEQNFNGDANGGLKPTDTDLNDRGKNTLGESNGKQGQEDENGREANEGKDMNVNPCEEKPVEEEKGKEIKKKRCATSRMTWTPALHFRFLEALNALGEKKAHPKALQRKMDVPSLTHRHIASHLQKYKARMKRHQSKNSTCDQSVMLNSPSGYRYIPQPQNPHPSTFMPSTPMTRPLGAPCLTLETLKEQLKVGANTPTSMIPSELSYPSKYQNMLNSTTPNADVLGCLEKPSDQFSMPIPGQMDAETDFLRELGEGSSNQSKGVEGATSSPNIPGVDLIEKILEAEDSENIDDLSGDDIDKLSQWLRELSDFN